MSKTSAGPDEDSRFNAESDSLIAEIKEELKQNRGMEGRTEAETRIIRGEEWQEEGDEDIEALHLIAGKQTKRKKWSKWKLTQTGLVRAMAECELAAEAEEEG